MNWGHLARLLAGPGKAALSAFGLFCIFYVLEWFTRSRRSQYGSRNFLHDLMFWMYYNSGLHRIIFNTALFSLLAPHLAFLNPGLLVGLPTLARYVVYTVVTDFLQYWLHRLQHGSRFMWAFHTVHHSQEHLSFSTLARMHPLELFVSDLVFLVSLTALGAPPHMWGPIYWVWEFLNSAQHTELPWRYGPLYRVFVSPAFHSFHHSIRAEHRDKNFGGILSIWDFIFGTAVDEKERCGLYGLTDVKMPTLASTFIVPFQLVYRTYFSRPKEETQRAATTASP